MDRHLVVDGTGHVAGKLASYVAKKLLTGWKVTVLATESICYTGPLHRHLGKYASYKHKRSIYNPARGPFHQREPSNYFKKVVRGMTPRKTKRGTSALERLTCYESIPKEFENAERVIFPKALLVARADNTRPHCTLGQILGKFGWSYGAFAQRLTSDLRDREAQFAKGEMEKAESRARMSQDPSFVAELEKRLVEYA